MKTLLLLLVILAYSVRSDLGACNGNWCASEVSQCQNDPECAGFLDCISPCSDTDIDCTQGCLTQYNDNDSAQKLFGCTNSMCFTQGKWGCFSNFCTNELANCNQDSICQTALGCAQQCYQWDTACILNCFDPSIGASDAVYDLQWCASNICSQSDDE